MQKSRLIKIIESDKRCHIQCYGDRYFPIAPARGKGAWLWDVDGKRYLDFLAGISVHILGYGNEKFTEALKEVLDNGILHTSNLFYNPIQAEYEEKLVKVLPMKNAKVFFCNSGAEAVSGAIKCAKKNKPRTKEAKLIAMKGSFHGRYGDALAATGQEKFRKSDQGWWRDLTQKVEFIEFNNVAELDKINRKTYAVIFEPVQGEYGIIEGEYRFLNGLRRRCDEVGAILIADEVQTAFGRTGKMFACEHYDIEPDIICMAKGIANGVPMGAFAVNERADLLKKGEHASTFGGTYIACAAAKATLDVIQKERLVKNSEKMGNLMRELIYHNLGKYDTDVIKQVRGKGLMIGIEVDSVERRDKLIKRCWEKPPRVIFGSAEKAIRALPPLIVNTEHIEEAVEKFCDAILPEIDTNKKIKIL